MGKVYIVPKPCPNNDRVSCADATQCGKCGWNPRVAERRLRDFLIKNGVVENEQKETPIQTGDNGEMQKTGVG